nr:hypothetical protein BaRGS_018386 [Batillaria attramentaria]
MDSFDAERHEGRYYIKYRSHIPQYIQILGVTSTAFDEDFVEADGGDYVTVDRSFVFDDGTCFPAPPLKMEVQGGKLVGEPEQLGRDLTSETTGYVLATDYKTTTAIYFDIKLNGLHSDDDSSVNIMLNDPNQPANMTVVSEALVQFCGSEAASLDFFASFDTDPAGHVPCMGLAPSVGGSDDDGDDDDDDGNDDDDDGDDERRRANVRGFPYDDDNDDDVDGK